MITGTEENQDMNRIKMSYMRKQLCLRDGRVENEEENGANYGKYYGMRAGEVGNGMSLLQCI